jgi:hypothetical protein
MKLQLNIIGVLLLLLSGIHMFFPGYFHWKEDLKSLSLINRQMMQVHAFFIALVVFWGIRLFFQLFVYSPELWKGKRRETVIHILFTCLWIYFSLLFLFPFMQ